LLADWLAIPLPCRAFISLDQDFAKAANTAAASRFWRLDTGAQNPIIGPEQETIRAAFNCPSASAPHQNGWRDAGPILACSESQFHGRYSPLTMLRPAETSALRQKRRR
jgi:hypothetical protein